MGKFSSRVPRIKFARSQSERPYSAVSTYYMILIPALILGVFGILMTFSATTVSYISQDANPYVKFSRSLLIIVAGVVIAVFCALQDAKKWQKWALPGFVIGVAAQLSVLVLGEEEGGHRSWVRIPIVNQIFQPGELLKITTCLFLAAVCVNLGKRISDPKAVLMGVGVPSVIAMGALMLSSDVGTALVFAAIIGGTLWVAGAPGKWFPLLLGGAAVGGTFLVFMNPTRIRRVLEAIPGLGEPKGDATLAPTQTDHVLWALGSGGLVGLGPGASREKWNYLPEAHTDFILAIVGEEFGLIGTLMVLFTMGVMVWGMLRLTAHANDAYIRVASGGMACWILSQALINIGMVTGLTPVIGVPFPLVSHGGSAFVFTAMAIGVLLSFSRQEAGISKSGKLSIATRGRDPRKQTARRRAGGTGSSQRAAGTRSTTKMAPKGKRHL